MRITVSERNCQVPPAVIERTHAQVGRLSKYEGRATAAEVVFMDEKHTRKVELIVHVDGASHVVARGDGADFRSALDQSIDRLRRQLREQRDRRRNHQAPPLSEGAPTE